MTTTLLTVIGILMTALLTVAGFVYIDMDAGSAMEGGMIASQGIMAMEESAASYTQANGVLPTSLDHLKSVGNIPQLPGFPASWAVGPGYVCLFAQRGTVADRSINDAARRLGPKAIVSGSCGQPGAPDSSIVLSYPMAS